MEEIVRQLGWRSLPGWILIFLGIVDVLEKANFVLEHISFLTDPWGRSALILLGLAYFFILLGIPVKVNIDSGGKPNG